MERFIWLIIMVPCSALFTGIGIYALRCKKPMWFWAGSKVEEYEITDIPKYNRANGIMWIAYSLVFWAGSLLGLFQMDAAGMVVAIGFNLPNRLVDWDCWNHRLALFGGCEAPLQRCLRHQRTHSIMNGHNAVGRNF